MKVRRVKFYQAIEFGKNKAISFLDVDSYKSVIYLAYLNDLELEITGNGIKISARDLEDVIVPLNNVAYYQLVKVEKSPAKKVV